MRSPAWLWKRQVWAFHATIAGAAVTAVSLLLFKPVWEAALLIGGLLSSAFLTLELIPVVYTYWRYWQLRRSQRMGVPLHEICGITMPGQCEAEA